MEMYFIIGFGYLEQTLIPAVVVWLMAACVQRALLCRTHRAVSSAKFAGQLGAELLFIWYTVAILKITGIIGMAFRLDWARNAVRAFRLTVPFAGGSMLMITLNLLLFVPFGFLLPMAIRWERWNWRWALLAGFGTSLVIEALQLFGGRLSEIDDLIINTLGTLTGFLLWRACHRILHGGNRSRALLAGTATVLSAALVLFGLSFLANGDQIQAAEDALYTEMGHRDEELNAIVEAYLYTPEGRMKIADEGIYSCCYSCAGLDFGNAAGHYVQTAAEILEYDRLFEVFFASPQRYTFHNNHELVLDGVSHLLFDLDNGTVWYGGNGGDFNGALRYEDKEHPFQPDESIAETIAEWEQART